jgi:hypothetical protein
MNSDQIMDLFCCPAAGSAPFCDEVLALFTHKQCSWYASEDVQFQQVIVAAVFCRAMFICGISANS